MNAAQHSCKQRDAVPHSEEAHVYGHILHAVQEEDNAHQEQQVVIARHHVLRAQVQEREPGRTLIAGKERCIGLGHAMRQRSVRNRTDDHYKQQKQHALRDPHPRRAIERSLPDSRAEFIC